MATLNDFVGFETGGGPVEHVATSSGSPLFSAVAARSGGFGLRLEGLNEAVEWSYLLSGVADGGGDYIFGFAVRLSDVSVTNQDLIEVRDTAPSQVMALDINSGDIRLSATDASAVATTAHSMVNNTWHFFEIWFENSATGAAEVYMDGSIISGLTVASEDFSGTVDGIVLLDQNQSSGTLDYDDMYVLSAATSSADRLGNVEVFKYQSLKTGQVPDDGGDNLNTNDWDDCGMTPLSEAVLSIYTTTGAGAVDSDATNGSPEGPSGDVRVDGTILAMKGVWRAQRGSGGSSSHYGLIGNDNTGTERSQELGLAQNSMTDNTYVSVSANVPTTSDYFRIGFETTGARNFECATMWGMILHEVPTGPEPHSGELNNPIFRPQLRGWGW